MTVDLAVIFPYICSLAALALTLMNLREKATKPGRDLQLRMANFESRIGEVEQSIREDRRSINRLLRMGSLQSESLAALMDHSLDGNHTEQLKKAADRLKAELYNLEDRT